MGVTAQMVHWPVGFLQALVERELHVVRFDNRDSGRSSHMVDAPTPDLAAALKGDLSSASYSLSDMAADAVGLLDAVELEAVHVVGASMSGGIAQLMAIEHPSRVRSLTAMMSTTGAPSVGQIHPATAQKLFADPPPRTREEAVASALRRVAIVGSPDYPADLALVAETAALAYDRDHDVVAMTRQALATVASGDRTARLRSVRVPTTIIHGLADTMCDPSGGRALAAAIPGAELVLIEGLGHNLPPGAWDRIADLVAAAVRRGEAAINDRQAGG
jgi:pimeloyl-ACP methyl ester carboxylesterase